MKLGSNRISKNDISKPLYGQDARVRADGKLLSNPPLRKKQISEPKDGRVIPDTLRGDLPRPGSRAFETAPGVPMFEPSTAEPRAPARKDPVRAKWMDALNPQQRADQKNKEKFLRDRVEQTRAEFRADRSVTNAISMREAEHNLNSFLSHGDMDLISRTSPTPHLDNARAREEVVRDRETDLKALTSGGSVKGMQKGEPVPRGTTGHKEIIKEAKRDYALAKEHLARYERDNAGAIRADLEKVAAHKEAAPAPAPAASTANLAPSVPPASGHQPRHQGQVGFAPYARHEDGTFDGVKRFDGKSSLPGRMSNLTPRVSQEVPHPRLESYPLKPGQVPGQGAKAESSASGSIPPRPAATTSMGAEPMSPLDNLRDMYRTSKNEYDLMRGGEASRFSDYDRSKAKAKAEHYRRSVVEEMKETKRNSAAPSTAPRRSDSSSSDEAPTIRQEGPSVNLAGIGVAGALPADATRLQRLERERDLSMADVARMRQELVLDPTGANLSLLNSAESRVQRTEDLIRKELAGQGE
jgi:hypothetical protein